MEGDELSAVWPITSWAPFCGEQKGVSPSVSHMVMGGEVEKGVVRTSGLESARR